MPESASRSPQPYARLCGLLYLYIIVAGSFAEVAVRSRLLTADPAVTARNILAQESLFRLGFTGEFLHLACDVGVAAILYVLFRSVDRPVALVATYMRLACLLILAVSGLSQFAVLRLLQSSYLGAFTPEQRQGLAQLALRLHADGYAISLLFFAFACLALGYLILRSRFLPQAIGVLMAIAGVCYLVNTLAHFLSPALAAKLFPPIFIPAFLAELSLSLWLLAKGIDTQRWRANPRNALN